jgi:hypothetical protein
LKLTQQALQKAEFETEVKAGESIRKVTKTVEVST